MVTRKEYMKNSADLHNDYFSQYVTDRTIGSVKRLLEDNEMKRVRAHKEGHFNDALPLYRKDFISNVMSFNAGLFRETGEWNTQSTRVWILCAALRMIRDE